MTVEIEDRRRKNDPDRMAGYGLSNGTWWTVVFLPGMDKLHCIVLELKKVSGR